MLYYNVCNYDNLIEFICTGTGESCIKLQMKYKLCIVGRDSHQTCDFNLKLFGSNFFVHSVERVANGVYIYCVKLLEKLFVINWECQYGKKELAK